MLSVNDSEYLRNPCGTYSIPYWKNKTIQIPPNMKIMHDREFEDELLLQYNDEKYFRLLHDLKDIKKIYSEEFYIKTASYRRYSTTSRTYQSFLPRFIRHI